MNNATNVAKEEIALLREYGSREKNKTVFTNRPYAKITSRLRAYSMRVGVLYNPAFYRLWIFTRGNLPRGRNHRKDGGDCDFTLAQRHYALVYVAGQREGFFILPALLMQEKIADEKVRTDFSKPKTD